jgi:hypothetical protein
MGHLHHDHRAGRRHPGNTVNARENMNPPAQSGRIELIVGQPRHPIQTTLPVLSHAVVDAELLRCDLAGFPPRIAPRMIIDDTKT